MRSFIASIILISGIGISFLIVKGSDGVSKSPVSVLLGDTPSNTHQFATLNNLPSHVNLFDSNSQTNLTNNVVSQYTAQILKANTKGAGKNAKVFLPNEDALNTIIRDQLTEGISVRYFTSKDIKVSDDNSKEAVAAYVKNISEVYNKNADSKKSPGFLPSISDYIVNNNQDSLTSYLSLVSSQIDGLLSAPVPSQIADLHLKLINAWQKRLALGTTILQSGDDPIKAVVAVQEISKSIDEEHSLILSLQEKFKNLL